MRKFTLVRPLTAKEKNRVELRIRSLMIRLKSMRSDIEMQGELKDLIEKYGSGLRNRLSDAYSKDHAPVKVSNPVYSGKGECDMTSIYLEYSTGLDEFLSNLNSEYDRLIRSSSAAVSLYSNIIALPEEYAKVLLLTFYYEEPVDSVRNIMFISRASYYRYKKEAITLLAYKELGIKYKEIET